MKRQNKKRTRKIRNLIFVCTLCAILLSVSTYAWFIGMKTVNVNPFEIKIATTEGLFLSMDGKTWSYNLNVNEAPTYAKNTNSWADSGLTPVSTVGDMDESVSRMKLYEKGSLTTTTGGYRLLTSRVHNYDEVDANSNIKEAEGYVAFDLFIRNLSGTAYYADDNVANEEAIYLTTNSTVEITKAGDNRGIEGTGIENSVRVAFAQIGRVIGTAGFNTDGDIAAKEVANITNITCDTVPTDESDQVVAVTGICRNAQIWEPNDTKHETNAISWYKTSCQERVESTQTEPFKYSGVKGSCLDVSATGYAPTYAISRRLEIADYVDVYDGAAYNKYTDSTVVYSNIDPETKIDSGYLGGEVNAAAATGGRGAYKLVEFPYFTDTDKAKTGADRPVFMTLAPNSITKVRVYIYIEGQDIDNYDFASLGAYISVNFGFTKERYNGEDIGYDGPEIPETNPTADPAVTPNNPVSEG